MKYVLIAMLLLATVVLGMPIGKDNDETQAGSKNSTMQSYLGGEHSPLKFSGIDTVLRTSSSTTNWLQIGWVDMLADNDENNVIAQRYNPEVFTLIIELDTLWAAGDSVGLGAIRFEMALDTTDNAIWNADSSNLFVADGNYTHAQYGTWRFEDLTSEVFTSNYPPYSYPLRVLHGGFIRFVFTGYTKTTFDQDVRINWTLICEN